MATPNVKIETFEVKLLKEGSEGLGFSITGRRPGATLQSAAPEVDHSEPLSIFVQHLATGGLAEREGTLKTGDQLVAVNEFNLLGVAYQEATNQLRSTRGLVTLLIAREVVQEKPSITTAALIEPANSASKSRTSESTATVPSTNGLAPNPADTSISQAARTDAGILSTNDQIPNAASALMSENAKPDTSIRSTYDSTSNLANWETFASETAKPDVVRHTAPIKLEQTASTSPLDDLLLAPLDIPISPAVLPKLQSVTSSANAEVKSENPKAKFEFESASEMKREVSKILSELETTAAVKSEIPAWALETARHRSSSSSSSEHDDVQSNTNKEIKNVEIKPNTSIDDIFSAESTLKQDVKTVEIEQNSEFDSIVAANLAASGSHLFQEVQPSVGVNFKKLPKVPSDEVNIKKSKLPWDSSSDEEEQHSKTIQQEIGKTPAVKVNQIFARGIPVNENLRRKSISSTASSSSDNDNAETGSWKHDNELKLGDDEIENPQTLKLKYELAQLQSKELERKLETTLTEIAKKEREMNGVGDKSRDGSGWNMESLERKLKDAETAAEKALNEIANYQRMLETSKADFALHERQLNIELNALSIKYSNTKVLLEQCRSRDHEYINQKAVMIQRHLDKEKEYVHLIGLLDHEIEELKKNSTDNESKKSPSLKINLPAATYSPEFYKPPFRGLQSPAPLQSPPAFPKASSDQDLAPSSPILTTIIGRGSVTSTEQMNMSNNNSALRSSYPQKSDSVQISPITQSIDVKVKRFSSSSSSSDDEKGEKAVSLRGTVPNSDGIKKLTNEEETPGYAPPPVPEQDLKAELKHEELQAQASQEVTFTFTSTGVTVHNAGEPYTVEVLSKLDQTDSSRLKPELSGRRRSISLSSSSGDSAEGPENLKKLQKMKSAPLGDFGELSGRADIGDLETRSLDDLNSVHRMDEDLGDAGKQAKKKKTTSFSNLRKLFSRQKSKGAYDPAEASAARDLQPSQSEVIPVEAGPKKSMKNRFFGRFGKSKPNEPVSEAKMAHNLSNSSPSLSRARRSSGEGQFDLQKESDVPAKRRNKYLVSLPKTKKNEKEEAKKKQKDRRDSSSSSTDSDRSFDNIRQPTSMHATITGSEPVSAIATAQKTEMNAENSAFPNFGSPSFALSGGFRNPPRPSDTQGQWQTFDQVEDHDQRTNISGQVQGQPSGQGKVQGQTSSQGQVGVQSQKLGPVVALPGKDLVEDDVQHYSNIDDIRVETKIEHSKEITVEQVQNVGQSAEATYYNQKQVQKVEHSAAAATYYNQSEIKTSTASVNTISGASIKPPTIPKPSTSGQYYNSQVIARSEDNIVNRGINRNEEYYVNQIETKPNSQVVALSSQFVDGNFPESNLVIQGDKRVLQERQESMMSYISTGNNGPDISLVDQWGVGEVCQWAEQAGLNFCLRDLIDKLLTGERIAKDSPQSLAKDLQLSGAEQQMFKAKVKELQSEFSKAKKLREKDRKQAEKMQKGQQKLLHRSSKKQQKQQLKQEQQQQNESSLEQHRQGIDDHEEAIEQRSQFVEQHQAQYELEQPMHDIRGLHEDDADA